MTVMKLEKESFSLLITFILKGFNLQDAFNVMLEFLNNLLSLDPLKDHCCLNVILFLQFFK